MAPKPTPVEDRFWPRVDKRGPDECWPWTGAGVRSAPFYGRIQVGKKLEGSHRVSYEIHHGPIPEGMLVCHRCDNPPCVNPSHLFVGTVSDNARDRNDKHRGNFHVGERHPNAVLDADDVENIRANKFNLTTREMASLFSVSQKTICAALNHETWRHI